jgi:hypothetical protein
MPIFRDQAGTGVFQFEPGDLVGFVQGVFQTGVLIESILGTKSKPAGLDFSLFTAAPKEDLIYFHRSRARPPSLAGAPLRARLVGRRPTVADREWNFAASGIPGGLRTSDHLGSRLLLAAAVLVSMLLRR